jgi:hypothetical protein
MARANFVAKARKDNPVAKRGESYWWWKFRHGPKRYSKDRPRPSQLTQSEFLSQAYEIEERAADLDFEDETVVDQIREMCDDIQALGEECEERRENMPESLQDSDTGQLLEQRAESCEELRSELDNAADSMEAHWNDFTEEYGEEPDADKDEDKHEKWTKARDEALSNMRGELDNIAWDFE